MADDVTRDVPPVHQTATFDQAYAGISATIDELVASYRRVRAQNAATREIDIAGLVAYLLESPNSRGSFVEHYVVAVVRLAEDAAERDALKAATRTALEIYRVHWQTVHARPRPSCETCRIGLTLSRELPRKVDSREEILAVLDGQPRTTTDRRGQPRTTTKSDACRDPGCTRTECLHLGTCFEDALDTDTTGETEHG